MPDDDESCDWFTYADEKQINQTYPILKDAPEQSKKRLCQQNKQIIITTYLACIPPDKTLHEAWNPHRSEQVKTWATPEKLQRIFTKYDTNSLLNMTEMVRMSINHHYPHTIDKYTVDDGNHRLTWAKQNNVSCVLAEVAESFTISQTSLISKK